MVKAAVVSTLFAALLAGVANAQRSNTTCQATYSWLKNAQGQDPCLLASYLSMPCSGSQGTWNSQPLDSTQYYLSPSATTANPCLCNEVFYSIVSACAYCQGAVVSTWFQWTPNCSAYQSVTYPVSVVSGTSIPGWATLPVPASGTWDATAAYNYALSASASITLGGSSTGGVSTASASGTVTLPSLSQSTSPASTQTSKSGGGSIVGAAVGGAVGGLGLLAGIGFLIWWFCLRKSESDSRNSGGLDYDGKVASPPIVQPWNPDAPNAYANVASTPAPMSPAPMSTAPMSSIPYTSPQQSYAPQPSQYSGPGSDGNGPTVYSESNSGYGGAPVQVTYGIANPCPQQPYQDANFASAASFNPNAGYNHPGGAYQQPQQQQQPNANLLEGFDGGMHAPPPRYETPAPGPSMGAAAGGWPNEKR